MLAMLDARHRERLVFPLGDLRRTRVRAMAREAGAARPPTPSRARRSASWARAGTRRSSSAPAAWRPRPGPIEDAAGRRLGTHRGPLALHRRPAPRDRPAGAGAALRARDRRRAQRRRRRAARGARHAPASRSRPRASTASSATSPSRCACATAAAPLRGRARPTPRRACASSSTIPPTASPRGRPRRSTATAASSRPVPSRLADDRRPAREDVVDWSDVLKLALSIFLILTGIGLAYLFLRMAGVFARLGVSVTRITDEVVPILNKAQTTVDGVNLELARVDEIMKTAVGATKGAEKTVQTVSSAVTAPVRKLTGLAAGRPRGRRHAARPPRRRRGRRAAPPPRGRRRRRPPPAPPPPGAPRPRRRRPGAAAAPAHAPPPAGAPAAARHAAPTDGAASSSSASSAALVGWLHSIGALDPKLWSETRRARARAHPRAAQGGARGRQARRRAGRGGARPRGARRPSSAAPGGERRGRWYTRRSDDDQRDPGGVPRLLRAPGASEDPLGVARPLRGRPSRAAHDRRHAAPEVVLPGRRRRRRRGA